MTHRRWLLLLLLAGVFAMHGVECTAAGGPAAGSGHSISMTAGAPGTAVVGEASATGHPVHSAASGGTVVFHAADMAASKAIGSGGHLAGLLGHLWTVCLAVLSIGLAALIAALTVLRVPTWLPPLPRACPRWARPHARLPGPELSALCVLRT